MTLIRTAQWPMISQFYSPRPVIISLQTHTHIPFKHAGKRFKLYTSLLWKSLMINDWTPCLFVFENGFSHFPKAVFCRGVYRICKGSNSNNYGPHFLKGGPELNTALKFPKKAKGGGPLQTCPCFVTFDK